MTTTTTPTTTAVDGFLASVRGDHRPEIWAEDAVIDAVVPMWRMAVAGRERIDAKLRGWFADPGELEEVRRHPIETGEIVELTLTWVEGGIPHAARQVNVLELDSDGRIARDHMWCGGRWSAALLAEMEAARDAD